MPSKPIQATLAFIFNKDLTKVLLITKQKPDQHKGLLNGLGGKLEANESHLDCVVREIEEEAGLKSKSKNWNKVGNITWIHWHVSVWTMVSRIKVNDFPDDSVDWYPVNDLPDNIIENLKWLIPLSKEINQQMKNNEMSLPSVEITYN